MKRFLTILFLWLAFPGFKTFASHDIGSELSYQCIAPGSFQVTYKYYRDCSGAGLSNNLSLNVKSPGCNIGRTVNLNKLGSVVARPYGPQIQIACNLMSPYVTYEIATYTGLLTFTPTEMACPDWILSVTSSGRAIMENITLGNQDLYTEAYLKLGNNLVNSSPVFDTLALPVPYVYAGQLVNTSVAAHDPDGDSLSYKLVQPMSAAGVVIPYTQLAGPAGYFVNPNPPMPYCNVCPSGIKNPQLGYIVGPFPFYSKEYPLLSFNANWTAIPPGGWAPPQIVPVYPFFKLKAYNGDLTFQPALYHDSTSWGQGRNKYLVSFQVDEFRKINGTVTKIGSVRRETMIVVVDGTPNLNPYITNINFTPNNQSVIDTVIRLRPGVPFTMQFTGTDPDPANVVIMASNATAVLPGAVFSKTTGSSPVGTITWTPTAAHIRNQPYYFNIIVKDNANPVRAVHVQTIALRVSNSGGVNGTGNDLGNVSNFVAFPNPANQEVNFKFNSTTPAQTILIYNTLGQEIDRLEVTNDAGGFQNLRWENATKFPAGTYLARLLISGKASQTIRFSKLQ